MKIPFSHALLPPIPALEIRLVNPITGQRSTYQHAFLDTGSDVTLFPIDLLEHLEIAPTREERVYGMWGGEQLVPVYKVDVVVGDYLLRDITVVGYLGEDTLIGRNVTNQLRLLLDGPDESVELLT
jgi:predicted aspartyl protease